MTMTFRHSLCRRAATNNSLSFILILLNSLEDYLNDIVGHLEDETNDLEEPEGPPNFAQAALLLQNSSSVYSRKVEYLYSLVYAALDDLASSTTGLVPKHQRKTADASIDEFNAFDPDMQFLLLDDVLPIDETEAGDKINLDEDDEYSADRNRLSITRLSTTRLSLGGMSVTRADQSSFGNKNVNEARSIMGSLFQQGDGAGSLKLVNGRCDVSDKGTLVMPGTALPESQKSRLDVNSSPAPADNDDDGGMSMMYDDDHDDGVGFELADDHDPTVHFETADNDPPMVQPAQKVETNKNDPWVLLNPHDIGPTKARPLRIGITYRLPEGLDEPPSKAVTGAHTRRRTFLARKPVDRAPPIVVSIATETFRATVANRRHQRVVAMTSLEEKDSMDQNESVNDSSMFHIAVARPRVPIKGLAFGDEFAYIAKAAAKRKASERRERRKLLAQDPQAVVEESEHLFGYDDYDAGDNDSIGGNYDDDGVGNTGIVSLADAHATPDARGQKPYERTSVRIVYSLSHS
jgi:condensin-2 complex subunit H2